MIAKRIATGLFLAGLMLTASCGGDSSPAQPGASAPAPAGTVVLPTANSTSTRALTSTSTASVTVTASSTATAGVSATTPVPAPTLAATAARPQPSVPAGASSVAATATPTVPVSATPPPTPTPAAAPAGKVAITVSGNSASFDRAVIRVRSGDMVTATFQNTDPGVDHNLSFGVPGLAHGESCKGPCVVSQTFTAPKAGSYYFFCTLHPISGDFIVAP